VKKYLALLFVLSIIACSDKEQEEMTSVEEEMLVDCIAEKLEEFSHKRYC